MQTSLLSFLPPRRCHRAQQNTSRVCLMQEAPQNFSTYGFSWGLSHRYALPSMYQNFRLQERMQVLSINHVFAESQLSEPLSSIREWQVHPQCQVCRRQLMASLVSGPFQRPLSQACYADSFVQSASLILGPDIFTAESLSAGQGRVRSRCSIGLSYAFQGLGFSQLKQIPLTISLSQKVMWLLQFSA